MERLGHSAYRWRRQIVLAALVLGGVAAIWSASLFDSVKPYGLADPDSESSRAYDVWEQQTGERMLPEVVLAIEPGVPVRRAAARRAVQEAASELESIPAVVRVRTPASDAELISVDRSTALVVGWLSASTDDLTDVGADVEDRFADDPEVTVGGAAVTASELNDTSQEDLKQIEMYAVPVLFLLSLFVFRSLVAAALPLVVAGLSIACTLGLLRLLSNVMEIDVFALNVVTGLGIGLALDYSLFVTSRFREELSRPATTGAALRMTMRSAGRMVLFSGLIVAVALGALCVFPQRFLYSTGVGAALVVLSSVIVSLTVLPAMLAMLGDRIDSLAPRRLRARPGGKRWYAFGCAVMRRPLLIASVVAASMIVVGLPALRMELTRADATVLPSQSSANRVDRAIDEGFPADPSARVTVLIAADPADAAKLDTASGLLAREDGVNEVVRVPTGDEGVLRRDAVLSVNPFSDRAVDAVKAARALDWGGRALVSGPPAELADQRSSLNEHLPIAAAIIVISTLFLLLALTRSVVLPAVALVMNMLTVSVAFGVLVLVFQDGRFEEALGFMSQTAIDSSVPILLFAVVFGLSTDYGVFLLQRIAEARPEAESETDAIATGMAKSGRLITAAAALFAVAMGAFAWSDLVSIKEVAIGTAVAVIVDATVVRALLFPSVLRMLGPWAWWAPGGRTHVRTGDSDRGYAAAVERSE